MEATQYERVCRDEEYTEPPPHQRVYYRHAQKGDLGWMVTKNGKDHIKYDRPDQDIIIPFDANAWQIEEEHRPYNPTQKVQIAFEADRQLCKLIGMHDKARKVWGDLSQRQRMAWIEKGPTKNVYRRKLYAAVMSSLREM